MSQRDGERAPCLSNSRRLYCLRRTAAVRANNDNGAISERLRHRMHELVRGIEIGAQSAALAREEEFGRVEIDQGGATGNKEYFRDLTPIRGPRCERFTQGTGIQGDGAHRTLSSIELDASTVL